jgi:hypothetical protein
LGRARPFQRRPLPRRKVESSPSARRFRLNRPPVSGARFPCPPIFPVSPIFPFYRR